MRKTLAATALLVAVVALGTTVINRLVTMGVQPDGSVLVPSGQRLTPAGKSVQLPFARPKDSAVSPDGKTLAVLATDGLQLFDATGTRTGSLSFGAGPMGIAWTPDGKTICASRSDGQISLIQNSTAGWKIIATIKPEFDAARGNPQATGLAVSPDGKKLYVGLSIRDAVSIIDLPTQKFERLVLVDVAPYHVAVSPDGKSVFVSCRGGVKQAEDTNSTAKTVNSVVKTDPGTDSVMDGTVCQINTSTYESKSYPAGRQPGSILVDGSTVYVANEDSDTITTFQLSNATLSNPKTTSIEPKDSKLYGAIPTALLKDSKTGHILATLGGINAVADLDPSKNLQITKLVPTGWFPISLGYLGDTLVVSNAKGIGGRVQSPPSHFTGRNLRPKDGVYYTHNNVGTIQFLSAKDLRDQSSKIVQNNNSHQELPARPDQKPVPVPERVGEPSVFKHVVFIIKENLTYDAVLGDLEGGNGDPSLCLFPDFVTPNHHDLSRQFVTLDNLYTSGTNSADGHQWTTQGLANAYSERNYSAYARSYPYDGGDALAYSPKGFIWNAALRQNKSVRVFGEFVDRPVVRNKETGKGGTFKEIWDDYRKKTGLFEIRAETSQDALRPLLNTRYIGFPGQVCDQYRADVFIDEFKEWKQKGKMPDLSVLLLPDDHTMGTSPDVPTPYAAVADNDLAMGRIIDAITNSEFWKDTLILVVEDDCQTGLDHVDGHRTFGLAISPYTRRGSVVSEMYNHPSILRTIGLVLGIPAMNRFDQAAEPMTACFTDTPDFTPYTHRTSRIALDTLNPPPSALTGEAKQWAVASSKLDWKEVDRADAETVTRSIWCFTHPGERFPEEYFNPNPMVGSDDDD